MKATPSAKLRTLVQIPPDVVTEIDRLVGPRRRAEFLIDLARRELRRQHLLKALSNTEPIWRDEDHPEMAGDSDAWVRKMRDESEARFQKMQRESES